MIVNISKETRCANKRTHALCCTVFLDLVLVYLPVLVPLLLFLQIPRIPHKYTCGFAPALAQPRMTSSHFLLYWTNHPYLKCSPPWRNSAKWLLFLQMVDVTVSWTCRAAYVDDFIHSLPLTIHELLQGMGQSDSYLFSPCPTQGPPRRFAVRLPSYSVTSVSFFFPQ